jgi:hypothetical protein
MRELFNRFSWDAIKFNDQVLACLVVIWGAVLLCAISSIRHQPFGKTQRAFWMTLVVTVPLLGLLLYLPFSFRAANYPELFFWRRNR